MFILCIWFGVMLIAAIIYICLLKKDVRQINEKIMDISHTETNTVLTTMTFDKGITDLTYGVNQVLEKYRRALADKNRAEADLKRALTNISHDLRTPLTSAIGYLQMLEADMQDLATLDSKTRMHYVRTVLNRLDALSLLMNSLFEFTRVIEGNVKFDVQRVNVCGVLRDALSSCYEELMKGGFAVEVSIPDTPVYTYLDETALRRIMQNVIKNVYVHGVEQMKLWLEGTDVYIANKVKDLPSIDVTQIFERFYTSDASRTHKNTGLGLAIARELLKRMGGGVTASAEDGWLVMKLSLPRERLNKDE